MKCTKRKVWDAVEKVSPLIHMEHSAYGDHENTIYDTEFTLPVSNTRIQSVVFCESGATVVVFPTWYKLPGQSKSDYWQFVLDGINDGILETDWLR